MNKAILIFACSLLALSVPSTATFGQVDSRPSAASVTPAPSYADLADLTDSTPLVIRAQIRKVVPLEADRAPGVRAGWARLFVEARTEALIGGERAVGEQLRYLADVRLDAKGKVPKLKKTSVVLFARPVADRPGEIQLVAPDAQLLWSAPLEARIRGLLAEFYASGAPQKVTGVREALHVPGTLAGQGETQVFLNAANGEPAALTISRTPGQEPHFSASFSELVGATAGLPPKDSLAWYRLACFLPPQLPARSNIGTDAADRAAAAQDYRALMTALGACSRTRG